MTFLEIVGVVALGLAGVGALIAAFLAFLVWTHTS